MKPDFATTEFLIQLHKWKELSKNDILPFSSITEENRNMHIFYDDTTPSFIGEGSQIYELFAPYVDDIVVSRVDIDFDTNDGNFDYIPQSLLERYHDFKNGLHGKYSTIHTREHGSFTIFDSRQVNLPTRDMLEYSKFKIKVNKDE